jgi:NTE family protein
MAVRQPNRAPTRAQWLRRLATRKRDRVAFVFSGGGPLGALQVGAVKALIEHGIKPDLVAGTSVGALNATFTAFDPSLEGAERLETIWRSLQDGQVFPGGRFKASWARMLVRGDKVFENSGIRRMVENRLGEDARFEDAQLPFCVVTTDLETGAEKLFSTGRVLEPLLASTAMPGIFPPVTIDGRKYTDGGVSNNVPIAPAIAMGATTLYVMNSTSHSHQRRPLNRPMDYLLHAFTLARSQRLNIEQALLGDKAKLIMIPSVPLKFFVPFGSMEHTPTLIELSYLHTKRFLEGRMEEPIDLGLSSEGGGASEGLR